MKDSLIINSSYARLDEFINKQTQLSEVTNEVYLTAGGYYQECYIAIFEELTSTDDSIKSDNELVEANVEFIAELFVKELLKKFPSKKFPFNKIVSVTLPSQIISKAIWQNLRRHNEIEYYTNKDVVEYSSELPKLVRLASYYSFSEEVQFKNIVAGDKVLVVNDVISTGNLIKDIHDSISSIGKDDDKPKPAGVSCVLSVVDSRVPDKNIDSLKHKKSIYFHSQKNFSEDLFLSLAKREIKKFKENPHPEKKLVRINPILNARITIESRHSEEDKIAFKKAKDFLERIPLDSMAIGHFSQNSLHHPYFIKSEKLFSEKNSDGNVGVKLVKSIYNEIINKEQKYDLDFHIKSIAYQLNSFEELLENYEEGANFQVERFKKELLGHLERTKKLAKHKKSEKSQKIQTLKKDDFVFYPVFSGIENLTVENIQDIFRVDYSNIIPLQRFGTNKGWRFIIPQKSFNKRLQGKKALIIDMGSFTGDSIIQMIDALCVFELKKIIVISLVGRLEDFDREFFSRIREMKVKILNSPSKPRPIRDSELENTLAPVNIYFGTNLHIPPSQSTKVCEHCQEIKALEEYGEVKEFQTTSAINYIVERLKQLVVRHVDDIEVNCPVYFPKSEDGSFDVLSFFTIRDHLGKIDGYRFYTDYYYFFDDLKEGGKGFKQKIEAIIAVTVHEKHLVKTIENQLPDVKQKIIRYINNILETSEGLKPLHYKWRTISILEAYFLFNKWAVIFEKNNFLIILDFIANNSENHTSDYSFIAFKMAEVYKNNKVENTYSQNELIKSVKEIWLSIEDNKSCKYFTLITEFNRLIINDVIAIGSEAVKPFYDLFNMYNLASGYKPSHSDLGISVNNLITSIIAFNIESKDTTLSFDSKNFRIEYEKAKKELLSITSNVEEISKYLNSLHKLLASNKFAPEYLTGEKSLANYLSRIDDIVSKNSDLTYHISQIQALLQEVEFEYFAPSTADNFYSLWKDNSYASIKDVWERFRGNHENGSNDFFDKYVDYKKYPQLIKTKLLSFTIVPDGSYTNVGANIHPFLLIKICKELLDNAIKYAENSTVKVILKSAFIEDLNLTYSVFIFTQDQCSKGEPEKGLADVKKILHDFNGYFKYSPNTDCLDIEIGIPITQYKVK